MKFRVKKGVPDNEIHISEKTAKKLGQNYRHASIAVYGELKAPYCSVCGTKFVPCSDYCYNCGIKRGPLPVKI